MRITHLSCGTMCPFGGRFFDGRSPFFGGADLVCHCLLVELADGLLLVDTGTGLRDCAAPDERLSRGMRRFLRVALEPERTAVRQIQALGYSPDDVRHVVLTHLDFDHAGGLDDFPHAKVHLTAAEQRTAGHRDTPIERARFRPQQWGDQARWCAYEPRGERWLGFEAVRGLEGLPPEVLLVPLAGHTLGHAGVALESSGRWLLHAGDAYFFRGEMDAKHPRCTPGLRAYQRLMEMDRRLRLTNQERLRELVREQRGSVRVFCAHDPVELEAFQNEAPPHTTSTGPVPPRRPEVRV